MPHKVGAGMIFGIVAEDGIPKASSPINLYDRTTGGLVNRQMTDAYGGYKFVGLDHTTSDYMVVATDEDGATPKNALVYDRIQPVYAGSGTECNSNWRVVLGKYQPTFVVSGKRPFSNGWSNTCFGGGKYAASNAYGTNVWGLSTGLPGAPDITSVRLNAGAVTMYSGVPSGEPFGASAEGYIKHTIFAILKMDADFTLSLAHTGQNNMPTALVMIRKKGTALEVRYATLPSPDSYANTAPSSFQLLLSYTLPAGKQTGFHSVAIVLRKNYAEPCELILDGVSVGTADMTAQLASNDTAAKSVVGFALFGPDSRTYATNQDPYSGSELAFATLIQAALTAAQVSEIHASFFVAAPPTMLGYVKEVITDGASSLFIPNATDMSAPLVEYLSTADTNTAWVDTLATKKQPSLSARGTLTFGAVSAIAGQIATDFTNGCYRGAGGCIPYVAAGGFEFVIRRTTTAAPTAIEIIACVAYNQYSQQFWYIGVTTSRKLYFWLNGSAVEALQTTYTVPDNVDVHVYFWIERSTSQWKLYINGALYQSGTPASTADLSTLPWNYLSNTYIPLSFELGGYCSNTGTVSNTFKGVISSFATHSGPILSADRIAAHYNSLGIV